MQDDPDAPITVEERRAVEELIARYNWALDENDADAYLGVFTPNGVFAGGTGTFTGHAELRCLIEDRVARNRGSQHFTSSLVLSRSGDELIGRCYCVIFGTGAEGPVVRIRGSYDDRIVCTDNKLFFAERTFRRWE
jgi:ketosteroid isomerase-like protein